ncbi:MAG: hypothetical protein KKB90_10575 [Actinobacteria bacterium]|nr:hypothetical protein [Actinomycetota bacterium]MBU4219390.1 hypothetical protein [Actinomycetota bacterium]MBU4358134.1 hypothetical protein [Actinomycetota bacterium]MCG2818163.1 hypothetical protein [Actinomycetes bacterium]
MDLQERVQPSDWVTGIGGFILFISVFLDWFKFSIGGLGMSGVGGASGVDATKLCYLIALLALVVIAVVVLRIVEVDLDAIPVPMSVVVMAAGGLSLLIVVLRMVIHQDFLSLNYGVFISLVAAIAVLVGGVLMQREGM